MKYTSNYKMKLPEQTDTINIDDLNENTKQLDSKVKELENKTATVTLSNTFEVVSASGTVSFYHGTMSGFSHILSSVITTFGNAVYRNSYGTITASAGSTISLAITLEIVDGVIYWDEYYNGFSGGDINIGSVTLTQTSTGDTTGTFSYVNDEASELKELEVRDAILELAQQIQALRTGE